MPRDRVRLSMLVIVFTLAGLCSATALASRNVLPNGVFGEGQKHWSLHTEQGAKATFKVESVDGNPTGHVQVTHASGRNSHGQLACAFAHAALQPGEIYRWSFSVWRE